MCETCGCGNPDNKVDFIIPGEKTPEQSVESNLHHQHEHHHHHGREIRVQENILLENNLLAERNRGFFLAKGIFTINLMSSPGSGKTTLLEKSIQALTPQHPVMVVEGDQQTTRDADRINATGVPVIQVNTGTGCHLDSKMIQTAIQKLNPPDDTLLFIENVGNLVCPALFDLGESKRVVIISVTEGDDKPQKYPNIFHDAHICIINKIDLLPYVNFNLDKCKQNALEVNHHLKFFEISATGGQGLDPWISWLVSQKHSG